MRHLIRRSIIVGTLLTTPALADNLLTNASFETEGPLGGFTVYTGIRGGGHSAAAGWVVFNNIAGTTVTELEGSDLPGGGRQMLRVETDAPLNGIGQTMLPYNTGPACVLEGVWVYVLSGEIYIGAGNGGNTGPNGYSTTTNQWEFIEATNIVCPANQFIIYASSAGGAEFYVDLASVEAVSCQGPPGDFDLDGTVGPADLAVLLGAWGPCPGGGQPCDADLTNDGVVGPADLAFLLGNWGCGD